MLGILPYYPSEVLVHDCNWKLQNFSMQIIDEIDGALGDGKGAVEVILKMVNTYKFLCASIVCNAVLLLYFRML